jgi:hypothetical protein
MKTKTIPSMILVAANLIPLLAVAQVPNPFQSATDAYNKAKQQLQQVGQGQPPAPAQPQPAASAAPPAQPSAAPVATAGQNWWICRYKDMKDPNKPVAGSRMYYAVLPADAAFLNDHWKHFNAYVEQNNKITDPNSKGNGFCRRVSNDAAGRANSTATFLKQWRSENFEPIEVAYADTPAQNAAIDAKLAGQGAPSPPAAKPPSSNQNAEKCAAMVAQGQKPPPYCSY